MAARTGFTSVVMSDVAYDTILNNKSGKTVMNNMSSVLFITVLPGLLLHQQLCQMVS